MYTNWSIRKPPHHVRVMIRFEDGGQYIGYHDGFGYIHTETGRILSESIYRPVDWKKIERNDWGDYVW